MKIFFLYFFILFLLRNYKRFYITTPITTGNFLLLIAHPDDESMFFGPTLLNLKGKIRIICLSKGNTLLNYTNIRQKELEALCNNYNYNLTMYNFLDNDNWDVQKITDILFYTYLVSPFDTLITFDKNGVSNHKNHISCYKASFLFRNIFKINTMYLKSLNIFQKYILNYRCGVKEYVLKFKDYFSVVKMMSYHRSQLVWFRYLYLMFSSYTSYNTYQN
ncbi:n-acetylglucosaminyl-phosphatidylinositol de-n-acetylase [Vairimorpha ceranae]|uniref:N-acetylglucosaminylphosphatidylinositol deacetylase n=1 Tax=Vairimorpha ceranae TaxID=40302 RepID=A0A0F9WGB2_9MICR|nr:n-acetylglucosaminyl-phosphatidylinositol de-n-acetylase [Vairimorpha ceranae]KAF5141380.1 hypothetical protein G9O61_00g006970 [Vairimorpha ceranae]KKO76346.1 n-acetylglucosaminyl-phosphatidylinositol de-n-acetylase [Vairimorpha ceranae]